MPILPDNAEQRWPSQRMPDSLALTNFSGIRSSAASSSVVNRGQLLEYEQQAPQAWQGRVSPATSTSSRGGGSHGAQRKAAGTRGGVKLRIHIHPPPPRVSRASTLPFQG